MLNTSSGFQNLLKEGYRTFSGLEEAILKNIEACKQISNMTKTSFGPNGMKKMVINHLEKIFVTSDAATIMRELEVQHPAAKMIVMAAKMQETECGDATNFVITLAGELLEQAESLVKMGLHSSYIIQGYEAALKKAIDFLEKLNCHELKDIHDVSQVAEAVKSSLSSKLSNYSDFFSDLLAQACVRCCPKNPNNFDQEYIRVGKILGGSIYDSFILPGIMVSRNAETTLNYFKNPKIAVYGSPIDTQAAETKGTILIKNADDLLNYTKSEEEHAEKVIKSIADSGVNVIVSGGSVSEICLHFIEKYKMMCVRVLSKFELRRICKCLGATGLVRIGAPTPEEMGRADEVIVQEIGSQKVTTFKRDSEDCKLATIVLRGSTNNILDDIERAIDDGVNLYRMALKDPRFVPGAGATEIQLASKLEHEASLLKGLDQYSFNKFAKAFEVFPRILAENAGLNSNETITKLYTANVSAPAGIDIETGNVKDSKELKVYDHLQSKLWAIRLACDAAITVLRVDHIIVAKPAGGPKPRGENKNWDED